MRRRGAIAIVLTWQQMLGATPSGAAVLLAAGKPVDAGASFGIPIVVPPGTGGLTPAAALAYSA